MIFRNDEKEKMYNSLVVPRHQLNHLLEGNSHVARNHLKDHEVRHTCELNHQQGLQRLKALETEKTLKF